MDYNIKDNQTGLSIRDFYEEDISKKSKINKITKFDMYHICHKEISKTGLAYILNLDTMEKEAILKGSKIDGNTKYFTEYSELLKFLDEN